MLGWLIMVANRPLGDSVVGFPFLFAVFAFFVSVKYAVIGYPFSKGFLFNVMTIVLAALYWVPFVGAIMGGIGLWTLASAALFSAGSLLIAGRRIPLNV